MTTSKQHSAGAEHTDQARLPGSFPAELAQCLGDWYFAWCWRRKMRRLLRLEGIGQVRLGSAHERVSAGAQMPLRLIVTRQAEWRRKSSR
ncbi:hypothetical protein SAMN05216381_2403 [Pseudomonas seleniipraecipitans]|uniref:Uncharacterized protein n=1 Tax=Phytopseudomonas seleniipraecipitans TaxID=640205 RepID=A0A1G7NTL7_9GAMM|nr:hypothetical protein SAMN05216381_2403 [Pseudomonas seleniipraecipitans]